MMATEVKESPDLRGSSAAPVCIFVSYYFRVSWMFALTAKCCPGVGIGDVRLPMAAWLSTKIQMVLVLVFSTVQCLA